MRPQLALAALVICGCAHAPRSISPAARAPAAAVEPAATRPIFELASLGLQVRVPGPVELIERDYRASDGPVHTQGVGCTVDSQLFFVARHFRAGRDRARDDALLQSSKSALKTVSREASVEQGEWAGIELEGSDEKGHAVWRRTYAVGDGFWMAQVQRSEGKLDRALARAFFDSIVLSQPWSVHAFPEGHFSALMPDGGVLLGKKFLHAENYTVAELSWLGGSQARAFGVWALPLEGTATADERMDGAAEQLVSDGNRIIWQAPVVVDTDSGRDFLTQKNDNWTRIRAIVSGTDLYMLQAVARTKEALLDESVTRFLASFRRY